MKKFILLFSIIFGGFAFGQVQNGVKHIKKEETTINAIEKPAEFPKGFNEFRKMISKNLSVENVKGDGKYYCDLYFIIDTDGSITEVKTIGENESFNKEAEIAIKKIKDKWIPATTDGISVRSKFRVPLNMTFEDDSGPAKFSKGEEVLKKNDY